MPEQFPPWAEAMQRLREEMAAWIKRSLPLNRKVRWLGGHDEGTFLSSWFGHYLLTGDERVAEFLRWMRDGWHEWAEKNLHHGYYGKGEVHHQPETFLLFLTRMLHLDPTHAPTIEAMDHLAHHIGNWAEGVPEWYDWDANRFRSWRLGTQTVEEAPPENCEVADHFRLLEILLVTHLVNGDERYLDLCKQCCRKWCKAILAEEGRVPGVLFPTDDLERIRADYPKKLVEMWRGGAEIGVEMHVAACSIDFLMDMFLLTEEEQTIAAVKKMMPCLIEAIADPYSDPPGVLYHKYRRITGDTFLDERAMDLVAAMPEADHVASHLMIADTQTLPHPMGIGRRNDAMRWGYRRTDGMLTEETGPSPGSLFLAWQITRSKEFLARSLDKAAGRLALARTLLVDGRHHGCAGGTVGAVASGHGRCPGIGHVTGTLYPAVFGGYRFCNAERPEVRYFTDGALGLPNGVAAVRPPGEFRVSFCNMDERPVQVEVAVEPVRPGLHGLARPAEGARVEVALLPGDVRTVRLT